MKSVLRYSCGLELFADSFVRVAGCIADLDAAGMTRNVREGICVNFRECFGRKREEIFCAHEFEVSLSFIGRIIESMNAISESVRPYFA